MIDCNNRKITQKYVFVFVCETGHNEEEKAFSISELLDCCAAAPDPSKEYKLFSCVGCNVFSVHLYSADRLGSTEMITRDWCRRSTHSVL